MSQFEALQNYANFISTPGADRWSRRGCELMNAYLVEVENRALAVFALAYHPETLRQHGEGVANDILSHAIPVIRNANRLYTIGSLLEVNYNDGPMLDQSAVEGFRRVLSRQLPALVDDARDMA